MLLEALIAMLIFSMGILAIVGLQAASIKNTTDAKYRTEASFLANQYVGQMWVDRANLANYATPSGSALSTLPEVSVLPSGTRTIVVLGNQVTITITWQLPGESTAHKFMTIAQING